MTFQPDKPRRWPLRLRRTFLIVVSILCCGMLSASAATIVFFVLIMCTFASVSIPVVSIPVMFWMGILAGTAYHAVVYFNQLQDRNTTQHHKAMPWQVSLRGLMMLMMIAAIGTGWYVDRKQLELQLEAKQHEWSAKRVEWIAKQDDLNHEIRRWRIKAGFHPGFQGRGLTDAEQAAFMEDEFARLQAKLDEARRTIRQLENR